MVSPHPTPLLVDVGTAIGEAGGVIQYGLVFLFAALPWVEILVVIPIAIGVGLNPVLTGIVAFAGNAGSVYVLLLFHRRIARWRRRRRSKPGDGDEPTGRRHEWAHGVWDRYGLPGLSRSQHPCSRASISLRSSHSPLEAAPGASAAG